MAPSCVRLHCINSTWLAHSFGTLKELNNMDESEINSVEARRKGGHQRRAIECHKWRSAGLGWQGDAGCSSYHCRCGLTWSSEKCIETMQSDCSHRQGRPFVIVHVIVCMSEVSARPCSMKLGFSLSSIISMISCRDGHSWMWPPSGVHLTGPMQDL